MILTTIEKAELFTHLATMENAGISAQQSFRQLRLRPRYQAQVQLCSRAIDRGSDIATAAYGAQLFDRFEYALIKAACAAGSPGLSYKRLASVYKEKAILEQRLKSRLRLPMFMLVFALIVLRLPALVLGSISTFQYLAGIVLPLFAIFGAVHVFRKRLESSRAPNTKIASSIKHDQLDQLLLKLPLFGPMILRDNAKQFFESLSLLLEAGVAMFEAVPLATQTVWNSEMRPHFLRMEGQLKDGWTLSQALNSNPMLGNEAVIELARTGESSGTLPEMLWRYALAETEAQSQFRDEIATWVPKIIYGMVATYIVIQIFRSGAFIPSLPLEAR
ncbi:type II secretion system F family protein [Undibacterium cyanobacteriorum]|uniref:Type II secretion system F family protein n=1 Tax=Undibacterium cyanobacteriorum TaxID=3073561 RepID=A0ABY9RNX4_9BURK|nr:type II secretion system F family protein [Undibacterium sp. 20NA77.5]WMW82380.1 type II secretion system F family protein [Undibacterium sp. 20NA77.5]